MSESHLTESEGRLARAARAQELRDRGLKLREIAAAMGVAYQTVHAWLSDPDGSKLAARKHSYRGTCEQCGGRTDGSNGRGRAPRVYKDCLTWSEDEIVTAMQRWAAEHGGIPPTTTEWRQCGPWWPVASTVVQSIGWNTALRLAGFAVRRDPGPGRQRLIEERLRAGVSVAEIARELGVSATAIYNRFTYRGTTVTEFRRHAAA